MSQSSGSAKTLTSDNTGTGNDFARALGVTQISDTISIAERMDAPERSVTPTLHLHQEVDLDPQIDESDRFSNRPGWPSRSSSSSPSPTIPETVATHLSQTAATQSVAGLSQHSEDEGGLKLRHRRMLEPEYLWDVDASDDVLTTYSSDLTSERSGSPAPSVFSFHSDSEFTMLSRHASIHRSSLDGCPRQRHGPSQWMVI